MQAINEVTSTVPHDYSAAAPTDTMHSDLKTAINNLIWMYAPETIRPWSIVAVFLTSKSVKTLILLKMFAISIFFLATMGR